MWGQNWGQMIWGSAGAVSVPAMGFWGTMLLGAALGIVGVRFLRGTRPRTLGALALTLALLIPISARAVALLTFTNGTVADANEVNANFAALKPVSGSHRASIGALSPGNGANFYIPSFVALRDMDCTVTADGDLRLIGPSPVYISLRAVNGTSNPTPGTSFDTPFSVGQSDPVGGGYRWEAAQTRHFSIGAGSTAQFGCGIYTVDDFGSYLTAGLCIITYICL